MECRTEGAQCAFVVDNILMNSSGQGGQGSLSPQFGNIAVLYRRQVSTLTNLWLFCSVSLFLHFPYVYMLRCSLLPY